jgi:glutaminyl-peptide cyclotransferase
MRALLCSCLFAFCASSALAQTCPVPKALTFHVEKQVQRDVPGFTQGLEMDSGALLEGTGNYVGETRINRIDPATGKVTALMNAGQRYFGEGVTIFRDRVYQLSWRENRVFVFDRQMRLLKEMENPRDGWGLTHDATRLIASDGSSRLFFLSPEDFRTLGSVRVTRNGRYVDNLNELEYVDGAVWANIFETWEVVKIDPATGCVEATADLRPLRARMNSMERSLIDSESNFVPNGIAYDPASGQFILTGKYWRTLFFGRFSGPN